MKSGACSGIHFLFNFPAKREREERNLLQKNLVNEIAKAGSFVRQRRRFHRIEEAGNLCKEKGFMFLCVIL